MKKYVIPSIIIVILLIVGAVLLINLIPQTAIDEGKHSTYGGWGFEGETLKYSGAEQNDQTGFISIHVFIADGAKEEMELGNKLKQYNSDLYTCNVEGSVTSLCRDEIILPGERCQVFSQAYNIDGEIIKIGRDDSIWACKVRTGDLYENLPDTFVRPSDGATRDVGRAGFSGSVIFQPIEIECNSPDEQCVDNVYYTCENYKWVNKGTSIGFCEVECLEDKNCFESFECIDFKCEEVFECLIDSDCENDSKCIDNECVIIIPPINLTYIIVGIVIVLITIGIIVFFLVRRK